MITRAETFAKTLKLVTSGLLVIGFFFTQAGFRWIGNPGDCAVEGSGWSSIDGGCKDPSGRVWAASRMAYGGLAATYSEDKTYCANLVEGGYSDWRLPTTAEFQAAVNNSAASHLYLPDQGWGRWLSETKGKMWGYFGHFQDGSVHQTLQTSRLDVMCVR